ncbi:DKNYY domain-containing protein [Sphingobacterium suaedae]|uniref:DKNYY domain-containing protein n=1 Tax=Sphingobacterium suaedae TaxID=1686402 RepID=A0ABW5KDZ8_9SPHI
MSRRALGHHFFVVDNTFILHFDRKVYQKFYADMDFESLEIVQSNGSTCHYFRDKQAVYVESYMNRFAVLPDADPADFHLLDFENGWSRSGVNDYVFDEKLPHRFDAYQALSPYYQRVDQTIYFGFTREVINADVASFEVLYGNRVKNVAKDKYHVYFREQVVEEADAATFHFLELFHGRLLPGA